MREILFKGKRADNNKWIYGSLIVDYPCCKNKVDESVKQYFILDLKTSDEKVKLIQVIPETIGQYTGLTDKNGEKVFEGDILRFDYIGKNLGVNGISLCEFENGKFGVKWGYHKEFVCLDGFANTTLEVIGNIHDNKELLDDK